MDQSSNYTIRPITRPDMPTLAGIDMGYESHEALLITRTIAPVTAHTAVLSTTQTAIQPITPMEQNIGVTYTMQLRFLKTPITVAYDWDWADADGFLNHVDDGSVFGAFTSDACLGLVELTLAPEGNAAQIESLYVHRPVRGQGIGKALIAAAVAWACEQDTRALLVTTQSGNVPAIRFYQRQGFSICGLHDHFYSNNDSAYNEAAIFMVRELPPNVTD